MASDINAKGYFFPFIAHADACNGCRYCLLVCPDTAVQVENRARSRSGPTDSPPRHSTVARAARTA